MIRSVAMAIALLIASSAVAQAQDRREPSDAMLTAGAEVLRGAERDRNPREIAAAVYAAMAAAAWQPIETARQDGSDMLLALVSNGEFVRGIGRWQVYDEPDKPGFWSVTEWFGAVPTHWMPLPPPPKR
jgi:hypothetical protein